MRLADIVLRLEAAGLNPQLTGEGVRDFDIDQLTADSRLVGPNGLFVAVRGATVDGHLFIDKAVNNGAIAIVHEAMSEHATPIEGLLPDIASVRVDNSQLALGIVASAVCDDPSHTVACVGVTGTNGKTTTSFLLYQLLEACGRKTGLIGTIEYRAGRKRIESSHTTPDAIALQRLLGSMKKEGCSYCSMEVSSHALSQKRTAGVEFRAGVFTNLTRDHLDYHGTMALYRDSKKELFDGLSSTAVAITNADDPSGTIIVADTDAHVTSYGQSDDADVQFDILDNGVDGIAMTLDGRLFHSPLVGRFNAYNLAATYTTAVALGLSPAVIRRTLEDARPVPGRFESISVSGGISAIVDYAHTPDALKNVLDTARELGRPTSKVICVFGCGGDRDATKRPMMGAIAEQLADRVIVTNDNPRTENAEKILDDIRNGMEQPDRAGWQMDRARAIRQALTEASSGDIVVIAGKGHETYQINGAQTIHFDDREIVRAFGGQYK